MARKTSRITQKSWKELAAEYNCSTKTIRRRLETHKKFFIVKTRKRLFTIAEIKFIYTLLGTPG